MISTSSWRPAPDRADTNNGARMERLQPRQLAGREQVALVEHIKDRSLRRADLEQDGSDGVGPPVAIDDSRVHDMKEQIGGRHLFERCVKRGDELVRQAVDEPDRVRDQNLARVRAASPAASADPG